MDIKKASPDNLSEKQLKERRDELKEKGEASTEEVLLNDTRKGGETEPLEALLRKKKNSGNQSLSGLIERRLNNASKDMYPHRNEDAWKRTGDKRPVNALNEEMGEGGDEGKLSRWEKAQKKAPGLGEKAVAGFNQKRAEENKKVKIAHEDMKNYLSYRMSKNLSAPSLKEAKKIDEELVAILHAASSDNRPLTKDEMIKIDELKQSKTKVLGVQWRNAI